MYSAHSSSEIPEVIENLENCMKVFPKNIGILEIMHKHLLDAITPSNKSSALKLLNSYILSYQQIPEQDLQTIIQILDSQIGPSFLIESTFKKLSVLDPKYNTTMFQILSRSQSLHLVDQLAKLLDTDLQTLCLQQRELMLNSVGNVKDWTYDGWQISAFKDLLIQSGIEGVEECTLNILISSLQHPDVRLKFQMLELVDQLSTQLQQWSLQFLQAFVIPTTAWKAGRSNLEIRKAALICVKKLLLNIQDCNQVYKQVLGTIKVCIEDMDEFLRMFSIQALDTLICSLNFDHESLNDIYPPLLQALEDSKQQIRQQIALCWVHFFIKLKQANIKFGNYEYCLKQLFVHLDDSAELIRKAISDALMEARDIDYSIFEVCCQQAIQVNTHKMDAKALLKD